MTAVTEQELKDHQKNIGGKRVTLEGLEANIKSTDFYVHPGSQLTICIITLLNGFTVTGESACADPSMFNEEIGQRIAADNAKKKIWPLMGYALKQELYLAGEGTTFKDRVKAEYKELCEKGGKLQAFIDGQEQFKRLSTEDQQLLLKQLSHMQMYVDVLEKRIERFVG